MDLKIKCPRVPNFVRVQMGDAEGTADVSTLSSKEVAQLGREWTAALAANVLRRKRRLAAGPEGR